MLGVAMRWTIQGRTELQVLLVKSCLPTETGISSNLMGYLAHMQTPPHLLSNSTNDMPLSILLYIETLSSH